MTLFTGTTMTDLLSRATAARATLAALLVGSSTIAFAQSAPIVQPGAPGEDSRDLSAEEAVELAGS